MTFKYYINWKIRYEWGSKVYKKEIKGQNIWFLIQNLSFNCHKGWASYLISLNLNFLMYAATAKSPQSCLTLCNPETAVHQAPPSLGFSRQEHWSGWHFLLQRMKVKSKSEVAQSCPTPSNPMDCSLPGSSIHGIFQARVGVGCHCLLHHIYMETNIPF